MRISITIVFASMLACAGAFATIQPEETGRVEVMPERQGRHIVVLADPSVPYALESRSHIIDADRGSYLGAISTGYWNGGAVLPESSNTMVFAETYFSRGTRGKRTDVLSIYDGATLDHVAEVDIPARRFTPVKQQNTTVLSDDDRFVFVLNHTPASSVTVVDLRERSFVNEIEIPGCFYLYPTGPRTLNTICSNGGFLMIEVDDTGATKSLRRTGPLFNPMEDPITNAGVRVGDTWYHVSQGGYLYGFRSANGEVTALKPVSLFTDSEREDDWRISGMQHLAIHKSSGRAYVLVHQGPRDTFEDPGTHVWVYDLQTGDVVERYKLERMAMSIEVSQDEKAQFYAVAVDFNIPFLFQIWMYLTEGEESLMKIMDLVLDIYDIDSFELQRSVGDIGKMSLYIQVWPAPGEGN